MNVSYKRFIVWGAVLVLGAIGVTRAGDWLVVNQTPHKSDAVIVLGGGPIERIRKGVSLYKAGYASHLIVSGGVPALGPMTQAEQMRQQAIAMGVPERAVLMDNRSQTTYQNAVYTEQMMKAHHFTSAIVVSSNFHMRRASLVFSLVYRGSGIRLGFVSSVDPQFHPARWWATPASRFLTISELIAIPINIVQGLIR